MVKKKSIYPYLLVAPALLIILCVVFIPVVNAIGMSFQSYDLRRPQDIQFIGLQNYVEAFQDKLFWRALGKTVIWVVAGVGFQFLFGFILALLLNKKFRGRGVVRAVSLIPWVTPGVLIGLMWRWMYDGNFGVINDLLKKMHLITENIPFLSQTNTAFPSVILTIVWQGIPFFCTNDSCRIAGVFQKNYMRQLILMELRDYKNLFRITIPSIKNYNLHYCAA